MKRLLVWLPMILLVSAAAYLQSQQPEYSESSHDLRCDGPWRRCVRYSHETPAKRWIYECVDRKTGEVLGRGEHWPMIQCAIGRQGVTTS